MWPRERRTDEDFSDEIEAHVALEVDQLMADGLSREEAMAKARRTLGNTTQIRERFFESRRVMWLEDLLADQTPRTSACSRGPFLGAWRDETTRSQRLLLERAAALMSSRFLVWRLDFWLDS